MRKLILSVTAMAIVALSGCAVYVPAPRAVVVAPAPAVIVTPGYYYHSHRW